MSTTHAQAVWPFPFSATAETGQCVQLRDLDAKQCAERRCAASGVCRYRVWADNLHRTARGKFPGEDPPDPPKENPVPVPVINLDNKSESAKLSISTNQQLDVVDYIDKNGDLLDDVTNHLMAARRAVAALQQGTVNEDMINVLVDDLSSAGIIIDEIVGEIFGIIEEEDGVTYTRANTTCGLGLSLKDCVETKCDARCQIGLNG